MLIIVVIVGREMFQMLFKTKYEEMAICNLRDWSFNNNCDDRTLQHYFKQIVLIQLNSEVVSGHAGNMSISLYTVLSFFNV